MLARRMIDAIKSLKGYSSNAEMARTLKISNATLSQIYAGNRRLSLDILDVWMREANLKADDVFRAFIKDYHVANAVPEREDMMHAMRTVVSACAERGLDLSTDDIATAMTFVLEDLYADRNRGLSEEEIENNMKHSASKIVRLYG